jgi:tetratricopeptide (TPR) repeat protein
MKYVAFLTNRLTYFRRVHLSGSDGAILSASLPINLDAAAMAVTESSYERQLIRRKGAYEVFKKVIRLEDLVIFRWKNADGPSPCLKVQLLHYGPRMVYLCLCSSTKAWYAIAQVTSTNDPILLSKYFASCRSYVHARFGFAPHLGLPSEVINHRPDLVSGHAVISIYGHWLTWAAKRISRGSGIYPIVGLPTDRTDDVSARKVLTERDLKRAVIETYREQPKRHYSRKPLRRQENNDSTMKGDKQDELTFLVDRVTFLHDLYEDSCAMLAAIAQGSGDTKLAIEQVERLIRLTSIPDRKSYCLLWLGSILEGVLDFEAAIACYGQAIAMEPADHKTWYFIHNNIGYCLNQVGKFVEAEWYCQAAISIDRSLYHAHKNLGVALAGQGERSRSVKSLVEAIRLNPSDPRALLHLEEIIRGHQELAEEIPNIEEVVMECRRAVRGRIGGRK